MFNHVNVLKTCLSHCISSFCFEMKVLLDFHEFSKSFGFLHFWPFLALFAIFASETGYQPESKVGP